MVASGVSVRRSVSPGWPFCPPLFLPEDSRRLLTRTGFFSPSLDGGLPLLLLFSPSRRSNSAMRASCATNSAMRSSFESWLSAVRSIESLNRHTHPLSKKIWVAQPSCPYVPCLGYDARPGLLRFFKYCDRKHLHQ